MSEKRIANSIPRLLASTLLLAFGLVAFAAVPAKALAAETYDLWVGGVAVSEENAADLTVIDGVDATAGGWVRFDSETSTLYLKDATITNKKTGATDQLSSGIWAEMDVVIEARGTNAVTGVTDGSYSRTSGIGVDGYHDVDPWDDFGLDFVLIDGAVLTCTGGSAPDGFAGSISSYGIFANPGNTAPVSVTGSGTLDARSGSSGDMLYNSYGFAPGSYVQGEGVIVNATGGGAQWNYGLYAGSADIQGGKLVAEAIGGSSAQRCEGILCRNSFAVSGGTVTATAGATAPDSDYATSYGFSKGQYGALVLTGGSFEAKTLATTGEHHALYYRVGSGMGDNVAVSPVKASMNADGSGALDYVAADNNTYNWFMAPAVRTVSFVAGGGSGEMAPVKVSYGESYTLPICGFTAPLGKEFAGWDAGAAGTPIAVDADLVLTAQWKAVPAPAPAPAPQPAPAPDPLAQLGEDGTPCGKGASAEAAEAAIVATPDNADPAGSAYSKLVLGLKATKASASSVKLTWGKVSGAKTYVVYGNACGKKNMYKKLMTTAKAKATFKKVAGKKVKKGTYYKFLVVALDANSRVVSTSKGVHIATPGGKVGNDKKVTTKAKGNKLALKKGKSFRLKAKAVAASKKLKVKKHRALKYESADPKVAAVSSKGIVKAKAKGKTDVYAYAQNGVAAKVKVTVK